MGLLGKLIVRVTVRVDRAVELLKRHEGVHEFVVSMQQPTQPLLFFNMMDLDIVSFSTLSKDSENAHNEALFAGEACKLRIVPRRPGSPRYVPLRG